MNWSLQKNLQPCRAIRYSGSCERTSGTPYGQTQGAASIRRGATLTRRSEAGELTGAVPQRRLSPIQYKPGPSPLPTPVKRLVPHGCKGGTFFAQHSPLRDTTGPRRGATLTRRSEAGELTGAVPQRRLSPIQYKPGPSPLPTPVKPLVPHGCKGGTFYGLSRGPGGMLL